MLLEREREIAAIEEALDGGAALLLLGAGGLGKSALIAHARRRAGERGVAVLAAAGHDLETVLPWGLARRLLDPGVRALPADARADLLDGPARAARELFGGRRAAGADDDPGLSVLHALFLVVATLAERAPLALLLDDAHWADEPTLRLVRYLAFRAPELPLSLIVAGRPAAASAEWDAVRGAMRCLTLAPLSAAAVAQLAGEPERGARIARLTQGNPFYVTRLLEAGLDAPAAVGDHAARTVEACGVDAVRYAEAVAVLGEDARIDIAARLAGLTVDAALDAADSLIAGGVLSAPLAFAHPIVRESLYARLPAGRRAKAHAAAAGLLPAERAAEHLLRCPPGAVPGAAATLAAAASSAARQGAAPAAVAYLERALEEPDAERAPLLVALGEARLAAGRADAPEAFAQALELAPDPELRLRLGWALHARGRPREAARMFDAGLAETSDPGLRAALQAGYVTAGMLHAETAADAQERLRDLDEAPAELLANVAVVRLFAAEPRTEVLRLVERAFGDGRLLEEHGPGRQALWHVVGCLSWCDELSRALSIAEAASARRVSVGDRAMAAYARSWPLLWTGRVELAVAEARSAVQIWHAGSPAYLPAALYWLVHGLLLQGCVDEAAAALAGVAFEDWEGTAFAGFLLAARAQLAQAQGDHAAALRDWLACGSVAVEGLRIVNPSVMPWRQEAAVAAAMAGDARAFDLAAESLALARRFGALRALGGALRTAGLVNDDLALLEESVSVLSRSPARLELARSLLVLGAALRRAGRRPEARERLHAAAALAGEALGLLDEIGVELRAAGGRTRRRPAREGVAALTASERRVAELAAAGLANREIAGRLFVTVKTVEWHLSRAFRKLGVSRRTELAAALAQIPGVAPS